MNDAFKAVMVVGARQVGKSTMLRHLAEDQNRAYVSMDNSRDRELAQTDPKLFFQVYKPPVLIDEVQKAPELFETIKILCDESEDRGLFWLTGSQSKRLMRQAGDSLAGRVCILKLYSLSQRELAQQTSEQNVAFLRRWRHFTDAYAVLIGCLGSLIAFFSGLRFSIFSGVAFWFY